ncbi:MAG: histidine kinase [Acidimicrobiia bacterium]|nr:histidine kinase [Acidimicrobiia bacterium]
MNRFAWIVGGTAAASLVAAFALAATADPLPASAILYMLTVPIPFLGAGLLLLWRHPGNRSAQLLVCGTAASMAYAALLEWMIKGQYADGGVAQWMAWALLAEALVMMVGLGCIARLIGLFPSGIPATRGEQVFARSTWLLPIPMALGLLVNEEVLVERVTYGDVDPFENPLYVDSLGWLGPATSWIRNGLGVIVLVAIGLLIVRYRRTDTTQRRQIRWVVFGSGAALALGMVPFIVAPVFGPDSLVHGQWLLTVGAFALLLIPVSVVMAIEQPDWVDSDAFISKSFTYGALSIGIFLIYGAIAAGLGLAAGAQLPLEIAIVVTAILAFAFQPTRARLQRIADRWVFGDRPTPIEAVTELDRRTSAPDGADLTEHLAETVRRAVRLRWVAVDLDSSATSGSRSGAEVHRAPVRSGEEAFGWIVCGPKLTGTFKKEDADLVDALAAQAALVISNTRLAARIVHAQEAERRRIERNIHDGAQQELVALVAKLGLARAKARNETLDEATLVELQRDAGTILKDLRDLAQGIHPSVLTDGGLVEAVEDRCSRLPIDVTVDSSPELRTLRFDADVEGAAYFFVTEGLTNVLKHSNATRARVELRRTNGDLSLRITDDGAGFDPAETRLNGLAGLTDRFAALAGQVIIDTTAGGGTVLGGRIPLRVGP